MMSLTRMTRQGLEGSARHAVCDVDLAVASPTADEETALVAHVFNEADVADGAVVHGQLHLLPWGMRRAIR